MNFCRFYQFWVLFASKWSLQPYVVRWFKQLFGPFSNLCLAILGNLRKLVLSSITWTDSSEMKMTSVGYSVLAFLASKEGFYATIGIILDSANCCRKMLQQGYCQLSLIWSFLSCIILFYACTPFCCLLGFNAEQWCVLELLLCSFSFISFFFCFLIFDLCTSAFL